MHAARPAKIGGPLFFAHLLDSAKFGTRRLLAEDLVPSDDLFITRGRDDNIIIIVA